MDEIGLPILGTPADAIDEAEDRERFDELLERCGIPPVSYTHLSRPSSVEETAFIMACSKLLPMAMTSPVAIIWVPRDLSA